MTDLFENADRAATAEVRRPKTVLPNAFACLSPGRSRCSLPPPPSSLGAWVTKNLVSEDGGRQEFVQLQLQGIIGEYLQAQAIEFDEQTAAQETAVFMATLDRTVAGLSKSGKVVLVHEAVIGGEVPDVTQSVKAAVYAKVPRPQIAQASIDMQQTQDARVEQEMQAFMAANGGGQGGVQQ